MSGCIGFLACDNQVPGTEAIGEVEGNEESLVIQCLVMELIADLLKNILAVEIICQGKGTARSLDKAKPRQA